jgi:rhodanese-related sulfurtransferase
MKTNQTISPGRAAEMIATGKAVLVDVREPDEHAREHIAGARSMPLSRFDGGSFVREGITGAIFHCASGRRTEQAATTLAACGLDTVLCLEGGLEGWKRAGLPVERNLRAPMPMQRQVMIAAGSLVVLGVILAALVSAWFILVCAAVGAGLIFAGATGLCGMARLLAIMPWNRRTAAEGAASLSVG